MAVPWYIFKHYFGKHSKFTAAVTLLVISTAIFFRYIHITLIAWSFLTGTLLAYSYLSPEFMIPNFLFMYTREKKKNADRDDEFTLMKAVCTVCGLRKCPRHRPELNILSFQPWTNLEIRKSVDDALDEVDVPALISDKLVKAGLQHLHAYLKARQSAQEGADLQKSTLEHMGPNLHYAMTSRKSELENLRRLVEKLFPYILRPQALQSKAMCALVREILAGSVIMPAMDVLANPDMINNIILIFSSPEHKVLKPPEPPVVPSPLVPFCGAFANQIFVSLSEPELPMKTCKSRILIKVV